LNVQRCLHHQSKYDCFMFYTVVQTVSYKSTKKILPPFLHSNTSGNSWFHCNSTYSGMSFVYTLLIIYQGIHLSINTLLQTLHSKLNATLQGLPSQWRLYWTDSSVPYDIKLLLPMKVKVALAIRIAIWVQTPVPPEKKSHMIWSVKPAQVFEPHCFSIDL
jgi:hypothetical protein